ncbi:Cell wall mannoprotein like [Verticillium longisporum]|nr:Cell wall mannoprotein like [Verticillium longisporum]
MKNTPVVLAAMVGTAMAAPQSQKAPAAAAPAGCSTTYADSFEISIVAAPEEVKRLEMRDAASCAGAPGSLVVNLKGGVLTDSKDRTGSIVANYQFQFDGPAQADAIYTSGFAVCDDNLLALGDQKTFFKCNSGNFANLYDRNWAPQCSPVAFYVRSCGKSKRSTQADYGAAPEPATPSSHPVTQIDDGQLQVPTGEPPKPPTQPTYPPVEPSKPAEPVYPEPSTPAEPEHPPSEPSKPAEPENPPTEPSKPPEPVYPEPTAPVEPTHPAPEPEHPVTQISDGQIQVPTGEPPAPPVETHPAPPPAPPVDTQPVAPPRSPGRDHSGPIEASSGRVIPGSIAALAVGAMGAFFLL